MRKTCLDTVYELAKEDKRIFFIGSDLGNGTLDKFKKEMPKRFLMEGVSEANLVGVAAGLALEGKIVYFNTISTFISRRAYEQVCLDAGLHKANIRFISNGGGLVYAPLGPTHLAIEDLSIMRAIPNMTVVAPADAKEMKKFMHQTVNYQGPIYIRVAKGNEPIVTQDDTPFEIGKATVIKEGTDALILTIGVTLEKAIIAHEELKQNNISAAVLHVPTIKPLDVQKIQEYISKIPVIVTIEENTLIGGLGSAVAEIIAENNYETQKKFRRIGIPDVFPDEYGSQNSLMEKYGITSKNLIKTVNYLLN